MKCPMLTMYAVTFKYPEEYEDRDCLEGECAWWDEPLGACAVFLLHRGLYALTRDIAEIKGKMPHEG